MINISIVAEGSRLAVLSSAMAYIEDEKESSTTLLCTLFDLFNGFADSTEHSVPVRIVVALDLVLADAILLDALLKLVSQLSGTRHVRIVELVL